MEHSYIGNEFVGVIENAILRNPSIVVWAGDYAEDKIYSACTESTEITSPAIVVEECYIVNHTKKQFVDKSKVKADKYGWKIHHLPLLTCEGNGEGGGDFFGKDPKGLVGSWARDLISIESVKPEKFKEIVFNLKEN